MQTPVHPKHKIRAIEGLRGLGILMVIGYMFFQHLFPGAYLYSNFFLFISGLLIFRKYHFFIASKREVKALSLYRQYYQGIFFPMLFVMVLSSLLAFLFKASAYQNIRMMGTSSLLLFNNLYQWWMGYAFVDMTNASSMFSHLWYLSLYGQLILLTPLLISLTYRWHKQVSLAVNILGVVTLVSMALTSYLMATGSTASAVYFNPLTRLSAFTMGGMFGLMMPLRWDPKPVQKPGQYWLNGISVLLGIIFYLMLSLMYGNGRFAVQWGLNLFTLLMVPWVMIGLRPGTWLHGLLTWQPIVNLGNKAFAYYLWSLPLVLLLPDVLRGLNQYYWLYQAITLLILVLFANMTYQLFWGANIQVPIGRHFDFKASHQALQDMMRQTGKMLLSKSVTFAYALVLILGFLAFAFAPANGDQEGQTVQKRIRDNTSLVLGTQSNDNTNTLVINNIPGLSQEVKLFANAMDVTFIGDSIFLVAAPQLLEVFPKAVIDADQSRHLYNAAYQVRALAEKQLLRDNVVVLLGTNSAFTSAQLDDFVQAIGSERSIYFVLVGANRAWSDRVNDKLTQAARTYANVKTIDWMSYVDANPSQFIDGIHPDQEGALALAKTIAEQIYRNR